MELLDRLQPVQTSFKLFRQTPFPRTLSSLFPSLSRLTLMIPKQTAYSTILILHTLEFLTTPPPHLPDLFPVLNLTVSAGVFGLAWLWGGKRLAQESWAIGGF